MQVIIIAVPINFVASSFIMKDTYISWNIGCIIVHLVIYYYIHYVDICMIEYSITLKISKGLKIWVPWFCVNIYNIFRVAPSSKSCTNKCIIVNNGPSILKQFLISSSLASVEACLTWVLRDNNPYYGIFLAQLEYLQNRCRNDGMTKSVLFSDSCHIRRLKWIYHVINTLGDAWGNSSYYMHVNY